MDENSSDENSMVNVGAERLKAKTVAFQGIVPGASSTPGRLVVADNVSLTQATVDRDLEITGLRLNSLLASGLTVKETAFFSVEAKVVDLSFSTFNTLDWDLRTRPATTDLSGISFRTLLVHPYPDSHPSTASALHFLKNSNFSASAFSAYQTQLRDRGEDIEAQRVYVAMREKMRHQDWTHWFSWPLGIVSLFQQYVLGFGRSPVPPVLWSFAFTIFGMFVFRDPSTMEPKVDKPVDFSSAWYSVELFLPIVDLGVAKEWRPKSSDKWRVGYARVHQMAGWILIPVALAAFTGVVK